MWLRPVFNMPKAVSMRLARPRAAILLVPRTAPGNASPAAKRRAKCTACQRCPKASLSARSLDTWSQQNHAHHHLKFSINIRSARERTDFAYRIVLPSADTLNPNGRSRKPSSVPSRSSRPVFGSKT